MFVCYFVNNTSAVFNVKNTSAVCCKVSVWKSPRVIAGCVETCLFCVFRQLALVYVAREKTQCLKGNQTQVKEQKFSVK